MARNRGTFEGDIQEKAFVTSFNSNKFSPLFNEYISNFSNYNLDEMYMVRVTTEQFSSLSNQKVKTRSDTYLIHSKDKHLSNILLTYDNYLDEDILTENNILHSKIDYSGVSVKLSDSKRYQILKLTPNSFKSMFNISELGAGACLYCMRESELAKNAALIESWLSTQKNMEIYFAEIINGMHNFYLHKEICKKIKSYSEQEIRKLIDSSKELQQKIFNGIHLYEEPYIAYYLFHNNILDNLTYIPYNITTGSGRSRGDYTLVLKPK